MKKSTETHASDRAREKLAAAKREITDAEADLADAMRAIETQLRAEKRTLSTTLERAFARLSRARKDLAELETILP